MKNDSLEKWKEVARIICGVWKGRQLTMVTTNPESHVKSVV
jgi:hypothetical protein